MFKLEGFDDTWFRDSVDFGILGYYVGHLLVNKIPVIEGLPVDTDSDNLKAFAAAAAAGGGIGLFHLVGITPEATTREAAFQNWTGYEANIITPKDLIEMRKTLSTAEDHHVDFVIMGCPHYSVNELRMVAQLVEGRKVDPATVVWVITSDPQYYIAEQSGLVKVLQEAGIFVVRDTCPMNAVLDWTGKTVMTDSSKVAQYAPAVNNVKIHMGSAAECIEAAVRGMVHKEEINGGN